MVKTVRDVDTRKVADAKEDLDTLLVFAGLFSAVVTTFVVDSYASLQPDNTDELVVLMRQSVSQNYTFADGVLRPVSPFLGQAPFEPPLWALRVNGLWFASLIVSLSTASFGMLVKQWLNEYVAMDWITPEEQLRARQFRYKGLEDWKVFEIAAMLPLLLHVSLGLFFIGLCFYTAAANDIIGRSTFPLISGWAFFALVSVVAPLASPRCPYKIVLLKAALRTGRHYVTPGLRRVATGFSLLVKYTWRSVSGITSALWRGFIRLCMAWLMHMEDNSSLLGVFLTLLFLFIVVLAFPAYIAVGTVGVVASVAFILGLLPSYLLYILLRPDPSWAEKEEEGLLRKPLIVDELLLSIDEVIINDGPMLATMVQMLQQSQASPPIIIAFALSCIRNRIGPSIRNRCIPDVHGPIRGMLELHSLSDAARNSLLRLVANTMNASAPSIEQWRGTQLGVPDT
ncbi:hypothetical protein PsYK624_115640 [Phanerochaete sordida]|uniref:DUF6535 domain-containing protein n=1 Tax=Phanerochaete sordida TaxID=48140 RepID=A0A9P3LHJ0_9APHY|nr:hypothetical protein PsYK624_115640 [Phanerochaete sordida]